MIVDSFLEFSVDQDISQDAGTYDGTNVVDMTVAKDLGAGRQLYVHFLITDTVEGTSSTVDFQVYSNDTADNSTTGGQFHVIGSSGPLAEALLLDTTVEGDAGTRIVVAINPNVNDSLGPVQRFLGVQYVVAVATTSQGTVSAYLTLEAAQGNRDYASGFVL